MHAWLLRSISYTTTLIFCFVQVAYPQTSSAPPISASASAGGPDTSSGQATPVFKREQLDQMLAPIALYPDDLLALIFMAATYPTEVVQADRWLKKPENSKLKGDQLEAALDNQTWDPSVKSLTQFPQVLETMSDNLDWTQKLGDAMLAQQQDVMQSVQRLRKSAEGAGTLQTTPQQTVTSQGDTIIIQPSDPQTVYVPAYNPQTAYGEWPYPSYPPPYYPPPPAYYPSYPAYPLGGALAAGLAFGVGVGIVGGMWGWGNCNWGGGSVNINRNTYNNINRSNIAAGRATQLPAGGANWRHDPGHRGGVAYRDRGSQQNFQRASTRPANARQNFSGRSGVGNAGVGANRPGGSIGANRPSTRPAGGANRAAAGAGANRASARPAAAANRASARPSAGAARQSPGAGIGGRPATATRPTPSAFSGMSNGRAANAQAARGAASRGSMSASSGNFGGAGARAGGGGGAARSGGGARGGGGGGGGRGGGRR